MMTVQLLQIAEMSQNVGTICWLQCASNSLERDDFRLEPAVPVDQRELNRC